MAGRRVWRRKYRHLHKKYKRAKRRARILSYESVDSQKKFVQIFDRHRVSLLAQTHSARAIHKACKYTGRAHRHGFLKKRSLTFCLTWAKVKYADFLARGPSVFDDKRKSGNSGRPFKLSVRERKAIAAQSVVDQDDLGITAKEFDHRMARKVKLSWGTVRRARLKFTIPDKKATVPHMLTADHLKQRRKFARRITSKHEDSWRHTQLDIDPKWAASPRYNGKIMHYNWVYDTIFADEAIIKPNKQILYAQDLRGPATLDIEEYTKDSEPWLRAVYEVKRDIYTEAERVFNQSEGIAAKQCAYADMGRAKAAMREAKEAFDNSNKQRVLPQAFYKGNTVDMNVNKCFEWLEGQRSPVTHCLLRRRFNPPAKGYDKAGKLMFMPVFSYYHKASQLVHFFDLRRDARYTKNPDQAPWVIAEQVSTDAKYFQERSEAMFKELFTKMKLARLAEQERRIAKGQKGADLTRLVMLQIDNASAHTAASTRKWLRKHNWLPFKQPARSPDFQPDEMVICKVKSLAWELLRSECERPYNLVDTVTCLDKAWSMIPQSFLQACIEHVVRHASDVLKVRGAYTTRHLSFNFDPTSTDSNSNSSSNSSRNRNSNRISNNNGNRRHRSILHPISD